MNSCNDVCDRIVEELNRLGFDIDPDDKDHDPILWALGQVNITRRAAAMPAAGERNTMRDNLPKKIRVIVLVDSQGHFRAQTASEWRFDERSGGYNHKGFEPLLQFNFPIRRIRKGWIVPYRWLIGKFIREQMGWRI